MIFIFFLLALDLGVFHKRSHVVSAREAMGWTTLWVSLSLLFSIAIYYMYENDIIANDMTGGRAVLKYLSGYLVEQSLSMDNIFVIAMIFNYFKVPAAYQHRVLFWGILGAIFFRGVMIALGIVLIHKFYWMTYVFGVLLLYSAWKMLKPGEEVEPNKNPTIKLVKRFFPVSKHYDGENFFVRRRHILAATPLFIALVAVETTDIMFAFDSIPAIFAITTDPFIVFTSNIFAILGLRSLYFVLAAFLDRFQYLKYSLVAILFFVGIKMMLQRHIEYPEWLSLTFILVSLLTGTLVSHWITKRKEAKGLSAEE